MLNSPQNKFPLSLLPTCPSDLHPQTPHGHHYWDVATTKACLDAALAWEHPPGMCIRPQAPKIERLGVMPGAASFPTLPSEHA